MEILITVLSSMDSVGCKDNFLKCYLQHVSTHLNVYWETGGFYQMKLMLN